MIADFVSRLLSVVFEKHEIGRAGDVYLTRWVLLGKRFGPGGKLFLHRFHRSDSDAALHDHPWNFWSIILWGGYHEETPAGLKWHWPFSFLRRPAEWRHRVVLARSWPKPWTLVWTGPRSRKWGFWCPRGWKPWDEVVAREDAGLPGCE